MTLENLDTITWSKLELVDGRATKAPAILRGLASGNLKQVEQGVAWLFEQVLHQSTPAPSAAAFVPFLLELAALPKQPARWALLALLGDLACGGDHEPYLMTGYRGDDPLHAAVAAGRDRIADALSDRAANARSAAAFALAWLPEHAARSTKELRAQLAKEKDPTARASMLMALAVLGSADAKATTAALAAREPVVQGAAVFVLARTRALPVKAKPVAAKHVVAGSVDALCWNHGQLGSLVLRSVLHAASRDGEIDHLIALMTSEVGHRVAPLVIELMFPTTIDATALTASQRDVLDQLTASPERFGQLAKVWKARGIPVQAAAARKALGLAPIASRMDTELTIGGTTRSFAAHLADAIKTPAKRAALGAALAKGRDAREVVTFCIESCGLGLTGDWQGAVVALLEACGAELVPVLRDVELYQSIQRADGAVITSEGFAAPALLVLAKRDPKLPDARLEAMSNPLRFTRDVDVEHDGPIAVAIARALRPAQRNALLAKLYRNTPSWVTSGKQLLEQVMVEAPADELTECLIQRVGELKAEYAYGRTYDSALFGKGYTPAKLEAMAPSTHPQTAPLLVHIRAYAAAARSKKLDQAIAKFLAM